MKVSDGVKCVNVREPRSGAELREQRQQSGTERWNGSTLERSGEDLNKWPWVNGLGPRSSTELQQPPVLDFGKAVNANVIHRYNEKGLMIYTFKGNSEL